MDVASIVFTALVFLLPVLMVIFIVWGINKKNRELRAQPVVQTTCSANVIYTIPTNDPSRFSTANISTTTSLRHNYDLPPSYDQVVIQSTVQTPQQPMTPSVVTPTSTSQLPDRPPNYAEVPK